MCWSASAHEELKQLLGDRYSVEASDLHGHGKDHYSYHDKGNPWAVVFPLNTDEVGHKLFDSVAC